jgi:S1-C subfamily serine protease
MDTAGGGEGFSAQQSTVGFAIPINTALSVAQQIAAGQASSTVTIGYPPFMGIYIPPSSSDANPADQAAQQGGGGSSGGFPGGGGFGGNGGQSCYNSNRGLTAPATIAPVSSGTLVVGVICNGPAQAIGMTAGSVITAVNGQAIGSPNSLTQTVSKYRPGTSIAVTWVAPSGGHHSANLTLLAGPPQ